MVMVDSYGWWLELEVELNLKGRQWRWRGIRGMTHESRALSTSVWKRTNGPA